MILAYVRPHINWELIIISYHFTINNMKIIATIWSGIMFLLVSFYSNQNINFDNSCKINLVLDSIQVTMGGRATDKLNLNMSNRYRVVTLINGEDKKYLNTIKSFKNLVEKIGIHHNYVFLVYVFGDKSNLIDDIRDDGLAYNYPVLYDSLNLFRETNYEMIGENYNTFLLDKNNEIILMDSELSENFSQKVVEHSKKQPIFLDSPPLRPKPLESNP